MVSRITIKYIQSLQKKKVREEEKLFAIEGDKLVREYLAAGQKLSLLVAKPEFISTLGQGDRALIGEIVPASYEELKRISSLTTPHNALAVVNMPDPPLFSAGSMQGLSIALESVQDPGNLGTIIRAAAWFGIRNIICSSGSVDVYNPKVIQASMGAILNVEVLYSELDFILGEAKKAGMPVYGTFLEGESIYTSELDERGIIVFGNESKGISGSLAPFITKRLFIPGFSVSDHGVESLNVGMAVSVVLSEFARRRK
ncbi:MAG: RNA methyltransferase [Bacteroidales bacterium]|jgi:TrmH family RNA methyltransferase|nr:RNA methyltransferase [Bacteroidales bacterium]